MKVTMCLLHSDISCVKVDVKAPKVTENNKNYRGVWLSHYVLTLSRWSCRVFMLEKNDKNCSKMSEFILTNTWLLSVFPHAKRKWRSCSQLQSFKANCRWAALRKPTFCLFVKFNKESGLYQPAGLIDIGRSQWPNRWSTFYSFFMFQHYYHVSVHLFILMICV